jgi:dihydroneopterin aldolase
MTDLTAFDYIWLHLTTFTYNVYDTLIERLATDIAETVLQQSKVQQVQVQLRKLTPPLPDFSGSIQIEITKTKSDL